MSPVHTVVRDAIETSGASDDNDVPIYVIESNVRHKLKLDIERAKNEEKRLRDLEKSLRRREVLKVFKYARISHILMFCILFDFVLTTCIYNSMRFYVEIALWIDRIKKHGKAKM